MFSGARWRMVGWSMLVVAVILFAVGVVLYVSLNRVLMSSVDSQLESASQSASVELVETGGTGELQREGYQAGVLYVVLASDGTVTANPWQLDIQALPPEILAPPSPTFDTVAIGGNAVRFYARRVTEPGGASGTLLVGQSLAAEEAAAQQLVVVLLLCGAIGLVLSFVGAWFLAARALGPIQHAFHRQQEFVADASHELRTPLTILHSAADLLASEPGHSNPALVLEIREEIGRMERLTRDLLTLARSDRGQLALSLGRVELGALAHELARRVSVLAEARAITLEVRTTDSHVLVEGDPDRLQQVGLIILDNALNHTPRGGTVTIEVRQRDGLGVLIVEDTGEGIPEEHLTRVFDRFHRVDPSRARDTGGAGLGLAIARSLVLAHGGDISIESGTERGTRVTIRLPLLAVGADLSGECLPGAAQTC